jgi:transcriptional regulator with XRE-family HTH domain
MSVAEPAPKYADLGRKLRSARKRCGISQENLAIKVGITRRHLIRLEFGQHLPSMPLRTAIAEATGVDAGTFRVAADDEDEEESDAVAALMKAIRLLVRGEVKQAATLRQASA